MNKLALLFQLMLAFSVPSAYAAEPSALVLVDNNLGTIRSGGTLANAQNAALDAVVSRQISQAFESAMQSGLSYGQAAGATLGAGLIAGAIVAGMEQSAADNQILPLTQLLTPKELESTMMAEVRSALKNDGIERVNIIRMDSPDIGALKRISEKDKDVSKLLIISSIGMPVMLTADRRSIVLSLKISQYESSGHNFKQLSARKLTVISPPLKTDMPELALNEWVELGKDNLMAVMRDSFTLALQYGLSQTANDKSDKAAAVRFVNVAGVFSVPGYLLAQNNNRITVVDYKGNIAVLSAEFVF